MEHRTPGGRDIQDRPIWVWLMFECTTRYPASDFTCWEVPRERSNIFALTFSDQPEFGPVLIQNGASLKIHQFQGERVLVWT